MEVGQNGGRFQPRTFAIGTLHSNSAVRKIKAEKKNCGKAELKHDDILTNKNIEEPTEHKLRFRPAVRLYHIYSRANRYTEEIDVPGAFTKDWRTPSNVSTLVNLLI